MLKVLSLVVMLLVTTAGTIKLSNTPIKENGVNFVELGTFTDEEDGFYKSIDTSVSDEGKVVVLDRGNYLIHVFDINGKRLTKFGKEGSGPGELTMRNGRIYAFKDRILVKSYTRMIFFDYSGKLIHEEKIIDYSGAKVFETKNGFKYVTDGSSFEKFLSKEFDFLGKEIKSVKNPNHVNRSNKPREYWVSNREKIAKEEFENPEDFQPYGKGYLQRYKGDYKLRILDSERNIISTVNKDFKRVADKYDYDKIIQNNIKNVPKEHRATYAKAMKQNFATNKKLTKGFKNDIQEVLGTYKNYIFLSVASPKDEAISYQGEMGVLKDYIIDVISPDLKLYTSIRLVDFEIENLKEATWVTIKGGKLIIEMENEEIGPYVKIFDIQI